MGMRGCAPARRAASGEPEAGRKVRWGTRRKEQVVLRLLRASRSTCLARETGQPASRRSR